MIPMYDTNLFCEIFPDADSFKTAYSETGFPDVFKNLIDPTTVSPSHTGTDTIDILYRLLLAKYASSPIANYSIDQFKLKLFSIIFNRGATWEKRVQIQNKFRDLSEAELLQGSSSITNHAFNPDTEPGTDSIETLTYINDQNVNTQKRDKLYAYNMLAQLLETDVTSEFIDSFKHLFLKIVKPYRTHIYGPYEEENDDSI